MMENTNGMKSELDKATSEVKRLKSTVENTNGMKSELEKATSEVKRLKSHLDEIANVKVELAKSTAENSRLRSFMGEIANVKVELAKSTAENSRLRSVMGENATVKLELAKATTEITHLKNIVDVASKLKDELNRTTDENKCLTKMIERKGTEINKHMEDHSHTKRELSRIQAEHTRNLEFHKTSSNDKTMSQQYIKENEKIKNELNTTNNELSRLTKKQKGCMDMLAKIDKVLEACTDYHTSHDSPLGLALINSRENIVEFIRGQQE